MLEIPEISGKSGKIRFPETEISGFRKQRPWKYRKNPEKLVPGITRNTGKIRKNPSSRSVSKIGERVP